MFEIGLFLHLNVYKQKIALMLNWIVWNRTVHMYKKDLALNNLQSSICYKTKPNKTKLNRASLLAWDCIVYLSSADKCNLWPCVRFHLRTLLTISSVLFQQCLTCFILLTWIVWEMQGKWSYNCCFEVGCFWDLLITARSHTIVLIRLRLGRIPALFYVNSSWCLSSPYVDIAFSRWDIVT